MSLVPAGYRVFVAIAVISGLLLTIGVVGAWRVQQLQKHASRILAVNVSSIRAAEEFEIIIREMRMNISHYLLTKDPKHLESLPGLRVDADRWLAEAERWSDTDYEKSLVERIKTGRDRLYRDIDQLHVAHRKGTADEAARELALDTFPREILGHAKEYLDFNERELADSSERNQATADRLVFGLSLLGICGCVAGLLAGYGIARGYSRRIVRLTVPIRNVAGRLNEVIGPVNLTATPSLEELERVMKGVSTQIETVINQWQQSQRAALHAEKLAAAGQLAAGLAHELRNPLTSMKILVQSASEQGEGGALDGRDLVVLEEEIDRLEGLVRTFLEFARPPKPELRQAELQPIIRQTVKLATYQIHRSGVTIDMQLPDEPLFAEVDSDQIRQLLLNLLLNALDVTPVSGKIQVTLAKSSNGTAGGDVVLTVKDQGPGLPGEIGERIFEPFVSTKTTGLGLGLAACRRICDTHRGRIEAQDSPNGGAEFRVSLPMVTPP